MHLKRHPKSKDIAWFEIKERPYYRCFNVIMHSNKQTGP